MTPSTTANVARFRFGNGLTLLVKENHSAPVAAVFAHVNVGYFNEPDHWNGIAHVVEHMFFKGTKNRPGKEQIAEEVRALGGSINAGTYYDETSYYIVLPSAGIERAIEIQADTFCCSLFDEAELAKEIEVIIQESKQKRDNPSAMLVETMYARAFDRHRIRRWRIGTDEILRSLRHVDLAQFVSETYRPENIVVTVTGDVETGRVAEWVERYWSGLERGALVKEASPAEPDRTRFRYGRMRGDIHQKLVEFGFHAPPVLHPDSAPLMVLGSVLSDGRSARLYRSLREEQRLASAAWAGYEGFDDIGLFTLGADSLADDPLEAERALLAEVSRIAAEGVGPEELARVKTRMESRRLYGQEEVLGMARLLASYEALGDYRLADDVMARLLAVTSEDVRRVADEYVRSDLATLQEYLPRLAEAPDRTASEMADALGVGKAGMDSRADRQPSRSAGTDAVTVKSLGRGGTLLFRRRSDLPLVALHVLFPGGRLGETARNAGITSLTLKSMLKGAGSLGAEEIANRIESLGSSIGVSVTPDYCGFSLKILASRLAEGLAILGEVIRSPQFPPGEVEKEKQALCAEIRRQQDSMSARAMDLFNGAMWGDTPYGLPGSGMADAVLQTSPDDLRAWHRRWITDRRAVVGVVGDVEESALSEMLDGLIPDNGEPAALPPALSITPPGERAVVVDKQQTAAVMGFPGVAATDDARHALDLLAEITSGLAGRFFQAVRGDNGLAYAVSSFHRARMFGGSFITYTATSPDREALARAILLKECARLRETLITPAEIESGKAAIRGERATGLQTFSAQAGEIAVSRLYGLPADAGERYVERVEALTAEELREAAARFLVEDHVWIGAVRGAAPAH